MKEYYTFPIEFSKQKRDLLLTEAREQRLIEHTLEAHLLRLLLHLEYNIQRKKCTDGATLNTTIPIYKQFAYIVAQIDGLTTGGVEYTLKQICSRVQNLISTQDD